MSLPMPTVRITEDYMEAYMTVPPSGTPENYTVEYLTDVLHLNHVKIGILPENLQKIIDNNLLLIRISLIKKESQALLLSTVLPELLLKSGPKQMI